MSNKSLTQRIRLANYGVVTMNNGIVEHKPLVAKNFFQDMFYRMYLFAEVKGVMSCEKRPNLRQYNKDEAKAMWLYHGRDIKFLGLKSQGVLSYKNLRTMFKSIDNIAQVKGVTSITGATNSVPRKIMERFGYEFTNKDESTFSYYLKILSK